MQAVNRSIKQEGRSQQPAREREPSVSDAESQPRQDGGTQVPARRRIQVTEATMQNALMLAQQGKVTVKNAWEVMVLEGMQDSVASCLTDQAVDQYQTFTKAANIVEGGAKVWTHRVENIYLQSTQTLQRMLRNNTKEEDNEQGEGNQGEDGEEGAAATQQKKKKKILERSLAETLDEIDLKDASRGNEAVSALFRAMTEKFDQTHAAGLLLNNAPYGPRGNMYLDRNAADMPDHLALSPRGSGRRSGRKSGDTHAAGIASSPTQSAATGEDAYLEAGASNDDIVIGRTPDGRRSVVEIAPATNVPYARPAEPAFNNALKFDDQADEAGVPSRAVSQGQPLSARPSVGHQEANYDDDDNGGDYGDYGPGAEGDDDDGEGNWGRARNSLDRSNIGSIARDLVSGRQELETMDQLALETETNGWIPLTQSQPNRRIGLNGRSKLLTTIRSQCAVPRTGPAGAGATQREGEDADQTNGRGAKAKSTKGGKQVSFSAAIMELTQGKAPLEPLKLNRTITAALTPFGREWLTSDRTTSELQDKYLNPLHCDAVSEKHRLHNATAYAAIFSRSRQGAEAFMTTGERLLGRPKVNYSALSSAGVAVDPSLNTRFFFQPFCTQSGNWNVLAKTMRDVRHSGGAGQASNLAIYNLHGENDHPGEEIAVGELPVDVFDYDHGDFGVDERDDHDDDAPLFNIPVAGEGAEDLPDLQFNGENGEPIPTITGAEVTRALKLTRATVPTMVDVVRLRRKMWDSAGKLLTQTKKDDHPSAAPASRKRGRVPDPEEESPDRVEIEEDQPNTFTSMVAETLPYVNSFSKDGTLSPAFFFFSTLFLANEHGLRLKSELGEVLDDIQFVQVPPRPSTN